MKISANATSGVWKGIKPLDVVYWAFFEPATPRSMAGVKPGGPVRFSASGKAACQAALDEHLLRSSETVCGLAKVLILEAAFFLSQTWMCLAQFERSDEKNDAKLHQIFFIPPVGQWVTEGKHRL